MPPLGSWGGGGQNATHLRLVRTDASNCSPLLLTYSSPRPQCGKLYSPALLFFILLWEWTSQFCHLSISIIILAYCLFALNSLCELQGTVYSFFRSFNQNARPTKNNKLFSLAWQLH
jgi:hypothetical protein